MATEIKSWDELGINAESLTQRKYKVMNCPECGKKKFTAILSRGRCYRVNCSMSDGVYIKGSAQGEMWAPKVYHRPAMPASAYLSEQHVSWLNLRGFDVKTITTARLYTADCPGLGECIGYPYFDGENNIQFIKFVKTETKDFRTSQSPELIFFGLQDLDYELDYITVFEGENDRLAAVQAGLKNTLSVPNGSVKGEAALEYIENSWRWICNFTRFNIWTDSDEAGEVLRGQLGRRLGEDNCWHIYTSNGLKDANDLLKFIGANAVTECFNTAAQKPIAELWDIDRAYPHLDDIRKGKSMTPIFFPTESPFFSSLKPRASSLNWWFGAGNSGKTTIVQQRALWLAAAYGYKFFIIDKEAYNEGHVYAKLVALICNKHVHSSNTRMMATDREYNDCIAFLKSHFYVITVAELRTLPDVFDAVRRSHAKHGFFGGIIDPIATLPGAYSSNAGDQVKIMQALCDLVVSTGLCLDVCGHPVKQSTPYNFKGVPRLDADSAMGGAFVRSLATNLIAVERFDGAKYREVEGFELPHTRITLHKVKLQPADGVYMHELPLFYDNFNSTGQFLATQPNGQFTQPLYEFIFRGGVERHAIWLEERDTAPYSPTPPIMNSLTKAADIPF